MRAVLQRVTDCSVSVENQVVGSIDQGVLAYIGIKTDDDPGDLAYIADKIVNTRIFPDEAGKMNLSVQDVAGGIILVSQFTLYGDARKGRRPSYSDAAAGEHARKLFEDLFVELLTRGLRVEKGIFQAHMKVRYVNDGPITILLDSRKQF